MFSQLPELILIVSLIVSILFIVLGVALVIGRVFKFTSDLLNLFEQDRRKEATQIKEEATVEAEHLLEDARITSLTTIKKSNEKASEIIQETETTVAEIAHDLQNVSASVVELHNKHVNEISTQLLSSYTALLGDLKSTSVNEMQETVRQLQQQLSSQIGELSQQVSVALSAVTNNLAREMRDKYANADSEIEKYKHEKMQRVDRDIYKILEEVSIGALGLTLSIQDTEKFIENKLKENFKELS
jgi:hypothetical protein